MMPVVDKLERVISLMMIVKKMPWSPSVQRVVLADFGVRKRREGWEGHLSSWPLLSSHSCITGDHC